MIQYMYITVLYDSSNVYHIDDNNCERSEISSAFNGPEFRYVYLFQVDYHAVNVLNVSTCI